MIVQRKLDHIGSSNPSLVRDFVFSEGGSAYIIREKTITSGPVSESCSRFPLRNKLKMMSRRLHREVRLFLSKVSH